MQDVTAVIVAAGMGRRFGGLKQFTKLIGKPLIYHSILTFASVHEIAEIILVVPARMVEQIGRDLLRIRLRKPISVVAGGALRQDSVQNGLGLVRTRYVAVHDGVRPYVSADLIRRGIAQVRRHRAVVFGVPVSDTVKMVKGRRVVSTIDRTNLFSVQTPQFFEVKTLRSSYARTHSKAVEFTDEAGAVESAGHTVYLFPGEERNIKITYRSQMSSVDKRSNPRRIRR